MTSETRMPASRASVSQAAPCARAENSVSIQGEARRAAGGRSFISDRILPSSPRCTLAGRIAATDRGLLPGDRLARRVLDVRAPGLANELLHRRGQGHVFQIVGHLVAVRVR